MMMSVGPINSWIAVQSKELRKRAKGQFFQRVFLPQQDNCVSCLTALELMKKCVCLQKPREVSENAAAADNLATSY